MSSQDQSFSTTLPVEISIAYRTYFPKEYSEQGSGHPLLFFMHGSGERGTDLDRLELQTLPRFIKEGLDLPFVTVCPQCKEMWDTRCLDLLLDEVIEKYNIDRSRVYVSGNSMGGLGTWMLANVAADRIAAIAPICAPSTRINPDNFKGLPVWCFHGALDSEVPIGESVKMVRLLRKAGCDVRFTVDPDADHDTWTAAYHDPELVSWLLSHHK
ncbi:MAG: prolyl oligopeptidase family serine peptidase [Pseudomonadales bacterium]|jgi:predicted peptidase|nr:prolyl oligopeptidase family serine peptidase [Pseudomonadales bacterium]MDP7357289.1 prolyl oligopeptidase family serine peptidase [Pseudomonadales bacterium]MDP7596260.1 prolyl oligopeptidase family serine peptidase [Pseudomonadales bacterium]HJN51002.1 prolyl oligopeptidase family serine peptidase [Pseudomonadales bacterium]|tara:strand:+ start:99 stop:737 length:639 start_codon:yes stop_codon:yes gene_type:complete